MFGGYQPETNRLSDMFVVELGKETVVCMCACVYVCVCVTVYVCMYI